MKWKQKAYLYRVLSSLPKGEELAFCLQRYVTKSLPRQPKQAYMNNLRFHFDNIKNNLESEEANIFEFGAGWDFFSNIGLWCCGVEHQTIVDLRKNARLDLINLELQRYREVYKDENFIRMPSNCKLSSFVELENEYGIKYEAPADARKTSLSDQSINALVSTNTFEHIPFDDLKDILLEAKRVLTRRGILSIIIDYSDHYSHADNTISPYNYMLYSKKKWQRYNPGLHYQNRKRHSDYINLFDSVGFELLYEHSIEGPWKDWFPIYESLSEDFVDRKEGDLWSIKGLFVLRKS